MVKIMVAVLVMNNGRTVIMDQARIEEEKRESLYTIDFSKVLFNVIDVWEITSPNQDTIKQDIDIFAPYINGILNLYQEQGASINIAIHGNMTQHKDLTISPNHTYTNPELLLEYCQSNNINTIFLCGCHAHQCIIKRPIGYRRLNELIQELTLPIQVKIAASLCRPLPSHVDYRIFNVLENDIVMI